MKVRRGLWKGLGKEFASILSPRAGGVSERQMVETIATLKGVIVRCGTSIETRIRFMQFSVSGRSPSYGGRNSRARRRSSYRAVGVLPLRSTSHLRDSDADKPTELLAGTDCR